VAARLKALGDDRVDSLLLEPARFFDVGGVADDHRARRFDAVKQNRVGETEMEAHDLWRDLLDDRAHLGIEGKPERVAIAGCDFELLVIGPEQCAPGAVVHLRRHRVAEEVEVERTAGSLTNLRGLRAQLIGGQHAARE